MTVSLDGWGPATVLLMLLVATAAIGGIVLVIAGTLSFADWMGYMQEFAVAVGILGVGRGVMKAGEKRAPDPTLVTSQNVERQNIS